MKPSLPRYVKEKVKGKWELYDTQEAVVVATADHPDKIDTSLKQLNHANKTEILSVQRSAD